MTITLNTLRPLPLAYLNSQFYFVPEAGRLRWAVRRKGVRIHTTAGGPRHVGDSFHIRLVGAMYPAELLVWALLHDAWPSLVPVHRNGDRGDNTEGNLYLPEGATAAPLPVGVML